MLMVAHMPRTGKHSSSGLLQHLSGTEQKRSCLEVGDLDLYKDKDLSRGHNACVYTYIHLIYTYQYTSYIYNI